MFGCITWTWNFTRRLCVYFLHDCKLLYIIRKWYFFIIITLQEHSFSSRITIVNLFYTVFFHPGSPFLWCNHLMAHQIVVIQINHCVLVHLCQVSEWTLAANIKTSFHELRMSLFGLLNFDWPLYSWWHGLNFILLQCTSFFLLHQVFLVLS